MSIYRLQVLSSPNPNGLRAEIEKIGAVLSFSLDQIAETFSAIKLEGISSKLARFLYQEMLLEGGWVALPAEMDDRSSQPVDVLILGTSTQFTHLVVRLETQNTDELSLLADELRRALVL